MKYAESQQIEAGAAVHLSLDELESVDLPFNLALTPGQLQRCFDGLLISCQAICEADQCSLLCRSKTAHETKVPRWTTFTPPQSAAPAAFCGLFLLRRSQTFLATVYFLGKCCQELLINHSIHG